jgi:glycosyltransferase involved in cell wall biosynthesis
MIVGGAQENTLLTIIGHLHKGHEVVLVTGPSPGPEGELLKKHDCPDFEIIENPHLLREINPLHDFAAYFSLKRFFQSRSFDVVHTHSSKAGIIGRAAAWAAKVPFVTHTVHGQAFHRYEKPWKNFIYKTSERWAAKHCHKIYAVAQAMIDQCVDANIAPASKYKVVYSGMELEPFLESKPDEKLRKHLGIPENAKVIGSIARLFPLKGYEYFIPAAKKVSQKHSEAHFLIVGDGTMTEDIKKQIMELGIEDKFSFAGLVPPNEIPRYASIMDVLAHFSLREGLPRAVVQALAAGKPAVAFNLDGSPEVIIDGKTGFIAEPEDIEGAANALSKLLSDPELAGRLGGNGRNFVMENWDWHLMSDILEKEYLEHLTQ